ncbi:hypothetical protein TNCV_3446131 [Trichonephila clavipes]|nr:hypothetical protein TNCV_3446131 [Trichonephila clavipes]
MKEDRCCKSFWQSPWEIDLGEDLRIDSVEKDLKILKVKNWKTVAKTIPWAGIPNRSFEGKGVEGTRLPDEEGGVLLGGCGTPLVMKTKMKMFQTTLSAQAPYPTLRGREISYTRAFGDGPRNFEPQSSDEDDT